MKGSSLHLCLLCQIWSIHIPDLHVVNRSIITDFLGGGGCLGCCNSPPTMVRVTASVKYSATNVLIYADEVGGIYHMVGNFRGVLIFIIFMEC